MAMKEFLDKYYFQSAGGVGANHVQ